MAMSTGTHKPVNNDTRAQTMAIPALGPSYSSRRLDQLHCQTIPTDLFLCTSRQMKMNIDHTWNLQWVFAAIRSDLQIIGVRLYPAQGQRTALFDNL